MENCTLTIKKIKANLVIETCQPLTDLLPDWSTALATNQLFFAAFLDDKNVGLIMIEFAAATNAHIHDILIHPEHVQPVAEKLLRAVESYCYERGYSSITAEIKPTDEAKRLSIIYERFGYKPLFQCRAPASNQVVAYLHKVLSLNDFIFVDLTHSLTPDVPHWGIDVGFKYNARTIETSNLNSDVKFRVQRLEMSSGIGTHMDAPSHCFQQADSIHEIPIQSLITVCRVIDVADKADEHYCVSREDIIKFEETYGTIPKNAFVIIRTGWDERWNEPEKYRNEKIFPHVSPRAVEILLTRDIVGVGIDTLSPDAFGSDFPVHRLLLGAGKYIIENVANAKELMPTGCFIFALPMKIAEGTEAPMRLIGLKPRTHR